jgi:hypothetical protein
MLFGRRAEKKSHLDAPRQARRRAQAKKSDTLKAKERKAARAANVAELRSLPVVDGVSDVPVPDRVCTACGATDLFFWRGPRHGAVGVRTRASRTPSIHPPTLRMCLRQVHPRGTASSARHGRGEVRSSDPRPRRDQRVCGRLTIVPPSATPEARGRPSHALPCARCSIARRTKSIPSTAASSNTSLRRLTSPPMRRRCPCWQKAAANVATCGPG